MVTPNYGRAAGASNGTNDDENGSIAKAVSINLYPNPAQEQFNVTHNLVLENGVITLSVYDLMGRAIITKQLNSGQTTVNTKMLKAGVYFYTITQKEITIKTDKLVIE